MERQSLEQVLERLTAKVHKTEHCWLWTAATTHDGYPRFASRSIPGEIFAHRVSYILLVGPIAPGLQVDHLCRVRHCVNPDHLEPVTPQVNHQRADHYAMGRGHRGWTHCVHGHPFSGDNLHIAPNGRRVCRTCSRDAQRRMKARRRARTA